MSCTPFHSSVVDEHAVGIAAVLDPIHYPALIRALSALWDLPTSPVRKSCMDALIVMIDDFESQPQFQPQRLVTSP